MLEAASKCKGCRLTNVEKIPQKILFNCEWTAEVFKHLKVYMRQSDIDNVRTYADMRFCHEQWDAGMYHSSRSMLHSIIKLTLWNLRTHFHHLHNKNLFSNFLTYTSEAKSKKCTSIAQYCKHGGKEPSLTTTVKYEVCAATAEANIPSMLAN